VFFYWIDRFGKKEEKKKKKSWSGKRELNPRLRPWQGRTLPLSYSRSAKVGNFYFKTGLLSSTENFYGKIF
jgi:hypothetical protein